MIEIDDEIDFFIDGNELRPIERLIKEQLTLSTKRLNPSTSVLPFFI